MDSEPLAIGLLRMFTPPLLDLGLINLSQIVDVGDLTGHGALDDLNTSAQHGALADGIGGRDGLDLDDADSGVVLAAVVHPIAEIAQPGLQGWRVVFRNGGAVGDDAGGAGDGGPAAVRGRDEGHVDVRVGFEVCRLTGLRVGVEEEVETARFLGDGTYGVRLCGSSMRRRRRRRSAEEKGQKWW